MSNKDFQNGFIAGLASSPNNIPRDWNENDETSPAHIKNRTHYKEEVEISYTVFPNIEPDYSTGFIEYGKTVGLEIGKEYTLEAHFLDGTIQTIQTVAIELPEDDLGITGIPCIILNGICTIVDGVAFDLITQTVTVGNNCYYKYGSKIVNTVDKGVITNLPHTETVVHKIPGEYIETDWDEGDENSVSHIKNRTHFDGVGFVKDFVFPEPSAFELIVEDNDVLTSGYALLGQKLNLKAGKPYTLHQELYLKDGDNDYTESETVELTAYTANQVIPELGDDWQDVVVLMADDTPVIIVGAMVTDFDDLSTFKKVDDTFYFGFTSKSPDLTITITLQNYNEVAHCLKTLDMKYIPMHKIINELMPIFEGAPDDSITTAKLKDQSVTTPKIADNSIKGYKLEQPKTLFTISVPADVQYIRQDLSVECKKVRIKGYLNIKTSSDSFTMSFGDGSWSKRITITDVPISENTPVWFTVFMSSMDSVKATTINGRELEIEYSAGNGESNKKYIKTFFDGYAFEQIHIGIDATVHSGSIQIDSVLSLEE
jgi:hypothetical protein